MLFAGRVQGVGFRYTSARIARRFPVSGFVRNLADGTVELIAAGTEASVDGFLAEVRQAFADHIDTNDTVSEVIPLPEAYSGFEIRR